MPRKKSLGEDFLGRLIVSVFLVYLLGGFGLLISIFIFMPLIREVVRELERSGFPRVGDVLTSIALPTLLRRGLIFEARELRAGNEGKLKVGFRNSSSRLMEVEINLERFNRYGEVSPARLRFSLGPGEMEYSFVRFTPRSGGTLTVNLEVRSGSTRVKVPVVMEVKGRKSREEKAYEVPITEEDKGEDYGVPNLRLLFSRYTEVEPIGAGGFARVYRAKRKDGKIVALKIPHYLTEQAGRTFLREVAVWSGLKHRNIVELYDANIVPVPYLEMEYCEGSLAGLKKPLHWEKVAEIAFGICDGLKYAHSREIIHRDLKPSNILIKNGTPKISDWGLSKVLTESGSTTTSFTPLYAAPEQISPSRFGKTDERTDIWQLGVLMYELVTGKVPFEGEDFVEIAGKIVMDEPTPPSELNPDSKPLEPVIMKCLAKRKEERYQSVKELQRDLANLLGGRYREELRKSVDFSRSAYYAGQLLILHMKLGDTKEALKYAIDMKRYARGDARKELERLIEELEVRLREGLPVPEELVERAEVLVHEIGRA
ncbi:serine/threonine protein kinase [Thermococcus gammatolerans]|uniref:non-specific serine/threonine protein kinase n=1 Tax=Thermococcus gammatolerans (strain DSM 15229 / JCM 11827 / EJ3) TaxID=593117 RepID=C5A5G9_THEGJ|nr:serine/threonine-protein kinase [Thermococcus gammatolerans]ACS33481.1 Serine/threonine protein kinase [Thermococcus gammatolerans EJ3]